MGRELVDIDKNELVINDAISRSRICLHYRLPTTEERVAFKRACLVKEAKRVSYDSNAARQKFGMEILTGFGEGAFTAGGKPVSSNPASPNFHEGWKDLVAKTASDLVDALAMTVFEGLTLAGGGALPELADDETEEEEAGEDADAPLPNNSGS